MLVLSRKVGERVVLPDNHVTLTVLDISGNSVRIGIAAPADVAVHREEVWRRIQSLAAQPAAVVPTSTACPVSTAPGAA